MRKSEENEDKKFNIYSSGSGRKFLAFLFGGWDTGIGILVFFMSIDFLSGLAVAGIFKKSTKKKTSAGVKSWF